MTTTANLALPYIEAAQAQKHVTHNEALRLIDTLVQLAVADRDLNAPPASPSEGQRWIVKASPAPTGAWAGHGNHIAAWQDGGWQFSTPRTGWIAFVVDEGTLLTWNGTAWGDFFSTVTAIQNLARLGVGTTADAINPISAKLNNALWVAKTVAEGGDGHMHYKLSKESAAKTVSLLLQSNLSGRAEVGLTGDDDFHFKVSADGTTWFEGIRLDRNTGKVSFPVMGGPRETLSANRTYYVRADGSDANTGLANTAGGAFLTIQKAVDVVASLDLSTRQATIQVGDGTYAGAVLLRPYLGTAAPIIQGNNATPANVLVSITAGDCFTNDGVLQPWIVKDLKMTTAGATSPGLIGNCLRVRNGGIILFQNVDFGSCVRYHVYVEGGTISATGNFAVSGGAVYHTTTQTGRYNCRDLTITYSNSPVFTSGNILCSVLGFVDLTNDTFTNGGTVTGTRYIVILNGVVTTNGGGANYIPGSVAGSASSGGQYF